MASRYFFMCNQGEEKKIENDSLTKSRKRMSTSQMKSNEISRWTDKLLWTLWTGVTCCTSCRLQVYFHSTTSLASFRFVCEWSLSVIEKKKKHPLTMMTIDSRQVICQLWCKEEDGCEYIKKSHYILSFLLSVRSWRWGWRNVPKKIVINKKI